MFLSSSHCIQSSATPCRSKLPYNSWITLFISLNITQVQVIFTHCFTGAISSQPVSLPPELTLINSPHSTVTERTFYYANLILLVGCLKLQWLPTGSEKRDKLLRKCSSCYCCKTNHTRLEFQIHHSGDSLSLFCSTRYGSSFGILADWE